MATTVIGTTVKDVLTSVIGEELMVVLQERLVVNVSEDAVTSGSSSMGVITTVAITKMETARTDAVTQIDFQIEMVLMRLKHVAFAEVESRLEETTETTMIIILIMDLLWKRSRNAY